MSPGAGSRTGPPVIAAHSGTRSSTVRAMGPQQSSVHDSGMMPSIGTVPGLGLSPLTPHSAAGMRIEPAVSVPIAPGHMPVATATAEPPLEPPGMRSVSQGFAVPGVITP